nr:transposase [Streptomyces sp. NWU339]
MSTALSASPHAVSPWSGAPPKKLRYRLLHAAARITRGGRRPRLRICATWPWRNELTSTFALLTALPRPAT